MKKLGSILAGALIFLLIMYFSMWAFLSQGPARKIQAYYDRLVPLVESSDGEGLKTELNNMYAGLNKIYFGYKQKQIMIFNQIPVEGLKKYNLSNPDTDQPGTYKMVEVPLDYSVNLNNFKMINLLVRPVRLNGRGMVFYRFGSSPTDYYEYREKMKSSMGNWYTMNINLTEDEFLKLVDGKSSSRDPARRKYFRVGDPDLSEITYLSAGIYATELKEKTLDGLVWFGCSYLKKDTQLTDDANPKKLYEALMNITQSHKDYFDADPDMSTAESKMDQLALLSDFIELVLARGEYAARSVPLGRVKGLLESYISVHDAVLSGLPLPVSCQFEHSIHKTLKQSFQHLQLSPGYDLNDELVLRRREYDYLLLGLQNVLKDYMANGDRESVLLAISEIDRKKVKRMEAPLLEVFLQSSDSSVKEVAAKGLLDMGFVKSGEVNNYMIAQLENATDLDEMSRILDLFSSSGHLQFMPVIAKYTNSSSENVRDRALNAYQRLKQ